MEGINIKSVKYLGHFGENEHDLCDLLNLEMCKSRVREKTDIIALH